jgi:hypothetical protein
MIVRSVVLTILSLQTVDNLKVRRYKASINWSYQNGLSWQAEWWQQTMKSHISFLHTNRTTRQWKSRNQTEFASHVPPMNAHNSPFALTGSVTKQRCNDSPWDIPRNTTRLHQRISTSITITTISEHNRKKHKGIITFFHQFIVCQTKGRASSKRSDTEHNGRLRLGGEN